MPYRVEIVETDIGKVERRVWHEPTIEPRPYIEPFDEELDRRMNDGTLDPESEFIDGRIAERVNAETPIGEIAETPPLVPPVPDSSGDHFGGKNVHSAEEQSVGNDSKKELYNTKDRPAYIQRAIQDAAKGLPRKEDLTVDTEGRTIGPGGRVVGRPPIIPGTPEWDAHAGQRSAAFEMYMRGKRVADIAKELDVSASLVKRRIEEAISELNTYPDHQALIDDKRHFAVERIKMIQKLALERFDTSPKNGRDAGIAARFLDVMLRAEELRTRIEGTSIEAIPIDEGSKGRTAQTRRIIVVRTDGPGVVSIAEATGIRDDGTAALSIDGGNRLREESGRGVQGVSVQSEAPS